MTSGSGGAFEPTHDHDRQTARRCDQHRDLERHEYIPPHFLRDGELREELILLMTLVHSDPALLALWQAAKDEPEMSASLEPEGSTVPPAHTPKSPGARRRHEGGGET
jgi:hypothetical protein